MASSLRPKAQAAGKSAAVDSQPRPCTSLRTPGWPDRRPLPHAPGCSPSIPRPCHPHPPASEPARQVCAQHLHGVTHGECCRPGQCGHHAPSPRSASRQRRRLPPGPWALKSRRQRRLRCCQRVVWRLRRCRRACSGCSASSLGGRVGVPGCWRCPCCRFWGATARARCCLGLSTALVLSCCRRAGCRSLHLCRCCFARPASRSCLLACRRTR
jgi:hypothetical protein